MSFDIETDGKTGKDRAFNVRILKKSEDGGEEGGDEDGGKGSKGKGKGKR